MIKKKKTVSKKVQNGLINKPEKVDNGLAEAVLGIPSLGAGVQLSQTDTVFKNLRFYFISNMRQPLSQAYVEIGVVRTIVDVPVDDGMRGGIIVKSKELAPEEIEDLQAQIEQENDVGIMGEALKWDRLYGGAGVLILTDQDPETPLELNAISPDSKIEFKAVDMWELFWDKQNIQGDGEPLDNVFTDMYRYYGKNIHKSRVMIMKGIKAPSFVRPRLRGWGVSAVEVLIRSINQYLKANDLTFEVLDEFKIDVYKIKNLTSTLLNPNGTQTVQQRVQLANMQKNYQHAITMDSEDDFLQKELSFTGLAETMTSIRMQVASDLRMPLTKVFGISAAGFSSGEDDIENYNAMVESSIRMKSKHHFINMVKVRCQKMFGYVPEDITIEFKPLRVLSSEQEENVKSQKFNRLLAAKQAGEITTKEFRDACNKSNLLEVQLDTDVELPNPESPDGDNKETKDITVPSAKKSATEAPLAKNSLKERNE
jgi:phage-related protein (TIGR01555 family)